MPETEYVILVDRYSHRYRVAKDRREEAERLICRFNDYVDAIEHGENPDGEESPNIPSWIEVLD